MINGIVGILKEMKGFKSRRNTEKMLAFKSICNVQHLSIKTLVYAFNFTNANAARFYCTRKSVKIIASNVLPLTSTISQLNRAAVILR